MATRSWSGAASDGDWNTAANWTGVTVPISGDTVIIDSTAQNLTGNLDQSAVDLARLEIGPGYTGKLGASGNALRIGVNGPVIINGGAASPDAIWLTGTTADLLALHVIHVGNGDNKGTIHLAGDITALYANWGNVVLESGTVTTLWIEGTGGSNDSVKITNVAATVTATHHFAGRYLAEDGATSVNTTYNNYSSGGGSANVEILDGTLTTYNSHHANAFAEWAAGSATMTAANVYSGRLSMTGSSQTVTNATVHNSALIDASAGSVTFTNPVSKFGSGNAIGSPGKTIQFS